MRQATTSSPPQGAKEAVLQGSPCPYAKVSFKDTRRISGLTLVPTKRP